MNVVPVVDVLHGKLAINKEVIVRGWVRARRDSKAGISFLDVYDGSCFDSVQVVINSSLQDYNDKILHLTIGCSVIVTGVLIVSPGQEQSFEIKASFIEVIGLVENPDTYPIAAKRHSIEYLREVAHLRPRTNLIGAIARVRHTLAQALHRFFSEKGYLWVSTPIITSSDTEGASEMFRVSTLDLENLPYTSDGKVNFNKDFFGKETFLTVSGQLNGETYACALSKIYTFGPTFRAENSNTSRHLAEFWMLEPEVAFANLNDIAELAEEMLKYVFKAVLIERADDMNYFTKCVNTDIIVCLQHFISTDFAKVDYTDAITILKKYSKKFKNQIHWGINFSPEHERYLVEKYFKTPVIIKNYPKDIKAFYMRLNDDGVTVAAMDILVPVIGEIIGGSQREERLDVLDTRMKEVGLDLVNYSWYRDLRRYGTVPHAGFGLGFERLISYVTGIQNVRDVIPFPRTPRRAYF